LLLLRSLWLCLRPIHPGPARAGVAVGPIAGAEAVAVEVPRTALTPPAGLRRPLLLLPLILRAGPLVEAAARPESLAPRPVIAEATAAVVLLLLLRSRPPVETAARSEFLAARPVIAESTAAVVLLLLLRSRPPVKSAARSEVLAARSVIAEATAAIVLRLLSLLLRSELAAAILGTEALPVARWT
jgi:hypothetical protein